MSATSVMRTARRPSSVAMYRAMAASFSRRSRPNRSISQESDPVSGDVVVRGDPDDVRFGSVRLGQSRLRLARVAESQADGRIQERFRDARQRARFERRGPRPSSDRGCSRDLSRISLCSAGSSNTFHHRRPSSQSDAGAAASAPRNCARRLHFGPLVVRADRRAAGVTPRSQRRWPEPRARHERTKDVGHHEWPPPSCARRSAGRSRLRRRRRWLRCPISLPTSTYSIGTSRRRESSR